MKTEKRASFFWTEKESSEGCRDSQDFPEEVEDELGLEKWVGVCKLREGKEGVLAEETMNE